MNLRPELKGEALSRVPEGIREWVEDYVDNWTALRNK